MQKKRKHETTKKKRRRSVLLAVAVTLAVIVLTVTLLLLLLPEDQAPTDPSGGSTVFYPPYDGDVRENGAYLALDRQFYLCDPDYGSREAIDDGQFAANAELALLRDYINSLIDGYPNACRSLFTASALDASPIPDFEQQMIYRVEISRVSQEVSGGEKRVTYSLSYMIYRNNGTYRRDVGSNAVRPEYLTLLEVSEGDYRIDGLRR